MTARSSYGGRYNRLHGKLGREDTCKDGSLEVIVPSRSLSMKTISLPSPMNSYLAASEEECWKGHSRL